MGLGWAMDHFSPFRDLLRGETPGRAGASAPGLLLPPSGRHSARPSPSLAVVTASAQIGIPGVVTCHRLSGSAPTLAHAYTPADPVVSAPPTQLAALRPASGTASSASPTATPQMHDITIIEPSCQNSQAVTTNLWHHAGKVNCSTTVLVCAQPALPVARQCGTECPSRYAEPALPATDGHLVPPWHTKRDAVLCSLRRRLRPAAAVGLSRRASAPGALAAAPNRGCGPGATHYGIADPAKACGAPAGAFARRRRRVGAA